MPNSFFRGCMHSFGKIDYFPIPLSFFLKGSEKSSTILGKIFSYSVLVFTLYSFAKSDLIKKTNPSFLKQENQLSFRPDIWLTKENFSVAIGLINSESKFLSDPTIFSLNLLVYDVRKQLSEKFELTLCSYDKFSYNSNDYVKLGLDKAFCLPDLSLKLGGFWNEDHFNYFSFVLNKCVNTSLNNNHCKPIDEINGILSSSFFHFYFTNNNIDFASSDNQFSNYFSVYSQQIDIKQIKIINVYLSPLQLQVDHGIYFEDLNYFETFHQSDVGFDRNILNENNITNFQVTFYANNVKTLVSMRYQKIQDLLAEIWGILHLVFIVGHFLAKLEHRFDFIRIASNELFIFQRLKKSKSKSPQATFFAHSTINNQTKDFKATINLIGVNELKLKVNEIPSPESKEEFQSIQSNSLTDKKTKELNSPQAIKYSDVEPNPEIECEGLNMSNISKDESAKLKPQKWKERLRSLLGSKMTVISRLAVKNPTKTKSLNYYINMKKKESRFDLGKFGYLKLLLKRKKWQLSEKEELYLMGEKQILKEMDIVEILKKLQDIEKLKKILLNENQRFFFDLLSKPMLKIKSSYDSFDSREKFSLEREKSLQKSNILELYESLEAKAKTSETDRRILNLLDEDVDYFIHK